MFSKLARIARSVALSLLLIGAAHAQIALDATSNATPAAASSLTWSHTVSGSNRLLHVSVAARDGGGTNNDATGVTYNGVALTKVRDDSSNFGTYRSSVWRLVAPATGANNIVVTFAGTVGIVAQASGVSLTGVDQTTPDAGNNGASDGNSTITSISASVTTTADNAWIIDVIKKGGDDIPADNGSQVAIYNVEDTGHYGVSRLGPITPAGATSVGWTWTNAANAVYSAAAYAPAATTATKKQLTTTGAG
jgi:hypothetical protein